MKKVSQQVIADINYNTGLDTAQVDDNKLAGPEVVFYDDKPSKSEVIDAHEAPVTSEPLEVELPLEGDHKQEVLISIELPGVDALDPEKEKELEIVEQIEKQEESKARSKWDWQNSHGVEKVLEWAKEMYKSVPKHTGYDIGGVERAMAYVEKLLSELTKAMRNDLEGSLDAKDVENVRKEIDKGLGLLKERLNKLNNKNKKGSYSNGSFVKEGQRAIGLKGVYITVPLLISRIARVCINSSVSAGRDIEDTFIRQAEKYKLTEREKAETMQLLFDMGYPLRSDRGFVIDDKENTPDGSNGYDFAVNYQS